MRNFPFQINDKFSTNLILNKEFIENYKAILDDHNKEDNIPSSILSNYNSWNETLGKFPKGTIHLMQKVTYYDYIKEKDNLKVDIEIIDNYKKNNKNYLIFETVYSKGLDTICRLETTYLMGLAKENNKNKKVSKNKKSTVNINDFNILNNYKVNQQKINEFANLSGGTADIHTNPAFAEKTSFKSTLVHGLYLKALIEKELSLIFNNWFQKGSMSITFLKPVKVNDEFSICINNKNDSTEVAVITDRGINVLGDVKII